MPAPTPSDAAPENDAPAAKAEQGFQVGHTYQVPIKFLKHNSSESSMAAQYFGDTALVRPQSDGTFKVNFSATSDGVGHIIQLAYNGTKLEQNNTEFTVSIPEADQDTIVPIEMTIKEMQQLGGGPQTADMHLYLSQATDLGTGKDSLAASSSKLAQTSDSIPSAGVVALAGVAAAAGAVAVGSGVALRCRARKAEQGE